MPNIKTRQPVNFLAGTTHTHALYGEYLVLERLPRTPGTNPRAVIRFLRTGSTLNVQVNNLYTDRVKDPRHPTVFGVGYLDMPGVPPRGAVLRYAYDLWANMLKRAYGGYDNNPGVTVEKRWHSFRQFVDTLHMVPGYELWATGENVHLDKDIRVPGNREYSLSACSFVPAHENIRDSASRRWSKRPPTEHNG